MTGYWDIHNHILPGVDDGSGCMRETMEMLEEEYRQGVRHIVFTPHYRRDMFAIPREEIQAVYARVCEMAADRFPEMEFYLGCEYYIHSDASVERLRGNPKYYMAGSRTVLMEFAYEASYAWIMQTVSEVRQMGLQPVLAHAERYECLYKGRDRVAELNEDNHLVKKYSGAVIDKVTVNKMTKNILHEGMLLVRKAGAFVQKLGLQNETDFLTDSMGDNLGFQFMVLAAIYMDHGHWAVEFENGDSFYNLLEMCTMLRTVDEEDSADLLETFTLLKNEMEEQGMDILHIDHYNMLRNYIYTVADIYKIFFDAIQKKLETMVWEIDSLVDKNPDFIATEGKFKGCIFYQTDTDSNRVDVFDPSGNIMADFSIFQSEAIRNYEKTRLGIQAGDPCS